MSDDPVTTTTAPDGVRPGHRLGGTRAPDRADRGHLDYLQRRRRSNGRGRDKADQLVAALENAGATAPSQDQIVRVLGDDGGAICEDPGSSLRRAILHGQLTNGATGPGMRPVIADNRVVRGQLLVIEIYCPRSSTTSATRSMTWTSTTW